MYRIRFDNVKSNVITLHPTQYIVLHMASLIFSMQILTRYEPQMAFGFWVSEKHFDQRGPHWNY